MILEAHAWQSGKRSRLWNTGSWVWIPLKAGFFPNLNDTSLHRALHVHPSIILIWLKYHWKIMKAPSYCMELRRQIHSLGLICQRRVKLYRWPLLLHNKCIQKHQEQPILLFSVQLRTLQSQILEQFNNFVNGQDVVYHQYGLLRCVVYHQN